jgi:hypothetical protein
MIYEIFVEYNIMIDTALRYTKQNESTRCCSDPAESQEQPVILYFVITIRLKVQ